MTHSVMLMRMSLDIETGLEPELLSFISTTKITE